MKKTLGGDRLGSGSKMQVEMKNYERSTHDLSYIWRSTMAAGTLVPCMTKVALPGDTWDIDLEMNCMTHPTEGPLFGSYKMQVDTFMAPIRLYKAELHNNELNIGMDMSSIFLPQISIEAKVLDAGVPDLDNAQINPSCLLSYIGIRGVGITTVSPKTREFNAIAILMYWDTYKNYYANKQEEEGRVIHTPFVTVIRTVDEISIFTPPATTTTLNEYPSSTPIVTILGSTIKIKYLTGVAPLPEQIIFNTSIGDLLGTEIVATPFVDNVGHTELNAPYWGTRYGSITINSWRYIDVNDINNGKPKVTAFPLTNIDDMRKAILRFPTADAFPVGTDDGDITPYSWLTNQSGEDGLTSSQEGLGLKTYQSDLFNNWVQTEWITGPTGVNAISAVDTSSGNFTIDTLILSRKVYDMMMRIAVSGGSYDDWIDVQYTHERYTRCESPMYMGGMIRELVFQEVVSNSETPDKPLGTLAGRGVMGQRKKGGHVTIKVDEPSYIMAIVSLTPRLDYSQGNAWDTHLRTINDIHKPALDEIGFQDLITEEMAWWDTKYDDATDTWKQKAVGKQPAWIQYMTSVNETRGNFAVPDNEMFMTLNRRYEANLNNPIEPKLQDATTYIDPSKYNFIFAETALDAQNFWMQIRFDITVRRKMSAKIMPNL